MNLQTIRTQASDINAKVVALRARQGDIHQKAADLRTAVANARRAIERAKDDLSAAHMAEARGEGGAEATAKARKALATAVSDAEKYQHADSELEALEAAGAGLEGDLSAMSVELSALGQAEKELAASHLGAMGEECRTRLLAVVEQLAYVYAECAALNELNEAAGGKPGRFSNSILSSIAISAVGPGWIDRPFIHIDPKAKLSAAKKAVRARMLDAGFKAI